MRLLHISAGVDCIIPPAGIAKLEHAFTGHMIAALILLHHHVASFTSSKEIVLLKVLCHLVVSALVGDQAGVRVREQQAVGTMGC